MHDLEKGEYGNATKNKTFLSLVWFEMYVSSKSAYCWFLYVSGITTNSLIFCVLFI